GRDAVVAKRQQAGRHWGGITAIRRDCTMRKLASARRTTWAPGSAHSCGAEDHWKGLLRDLALVERAHLARDLIEGILDGEVARIQPMHLCLRKNVEVRVTALWCEEDVVLTPEDDRFRLPVPQEGLPFRVKLDVGAVVVEQIELHLLGAGTR